MRSTSRTLSVWATLGSVLCLLGCGANGTIVLFGPQEPLSASAIELTRVRSASPSDDGSCRDEVNQTLTIDLPSGRATFTDTDGRTYPQQLASQTAARIQEELADRSFYAARNVKASKDVEKPTHYRMTVSAEEGNSEKSLRFSYPPRKPLPDSVALLVDTFDQVHRMVHPLSTKINLID